MNKKAIILDCTLRDGSYLIDYQFNAEDSFVIAKALSQAGIEYIEVGHGLGLDAQYKGKGKAAEDDLRYIEASVAAVENRSKIGAFFIPGIGELSSIKKMAAAGMSFIRIGTNIYESKQAEESIKYAKDLGLEVSANLMKSYAVSPEEFVEHAKVVEKFGADMISLVDSAGGMIPTEVSSYIRAAKEEIKAQLGFHGHNNLQLANANCIAALEAGAQIVDSSLRGMGRSAGNAITEVLAALLQREGFVIGNIDWKKLIQIAENLVVPLLPHGMGVNLDDLASGISYFHSSYQQTVDRVSKQYDIQPYEVILQIGSQGKAFITEEMAEIAAQQVVDMATPYNAKRSVSAGVIPWKAPQVERVSELWKRVEEAAAKTGAKPVLSIARPRYQNSIPIKMTPIRSSQGYCVAHIESANKESDTAIFKELEVIPSRLMLEPVIDCPFQDDQCEVVFYDDDLLTIQSVTDFVRLKRSIKSFYLPESNEKILDLCRKELTLFTKSGTEAVDVAISIGTNINLFTSDIKKIRDGGILLLAHPSAIEKKAVDLARSKKLEIIRLDLSEALVGEVSRLFSTKERLKTHAGIINFENLQIVSGGYVGSEGDAIVNSISKPTRIFGVADGYGGVLAQKNFSKEKYLKIMEWILLKLEI
jgi:4-hydroxy 2-oxovalerate aldolase